MSGSCRTVAITDDQTTSSRHASTARSLPHRSCPHPVLLRGRKFLLTHSYSSTSQCCFSLSSTRSTYIGGLVYNYRLPRSSSITCGLAISHLSYISNQNSQLTHVLLHVYTHAVFLRTHTFTLDRLLFIVIYFYIWVL